MIQKLLITLALSANLSTAFSNTTEVALEQLERTRNALTRQIIQLDQTIARIQSQHVQADAFLELVRFQYTYTSANYSHISVVGDFTGDDVFPQAQVEFIYNNEVIKRADLGWENQDGQKNSLYMNLILPQRVDLNSGGFQVRFIGKEGLTKLFNIACRSTSPNTKCN